MINYFNNHPTHIPWNKRKIIGQKLPLKLKEIWSIRVRLQLHGNKRNLALFNLAIDSKLRGCDLIKLRFVRRQTLLDKVSSDLRDTLAHLG
jgi:hypothetical protein